MVFVQILTTLLAGVLLVAVSIVQRRRSHTSKVQQHGCAPTTRLPTREPFLSIDAQIAMHTDIPSLHRHHQGFGQTFEIRPLLTLPKVATIAPANLRAINQGKDWGIENMRLPGMEDFCGRGFLTTDGEIWQRSRKLLKPTFAKSNLQDLRYLSKQVDTMFAQVPQDGETVDLQPLLYDMFLNTSIKFLLGVDPTQGRGGAPHTSEKFIESFHDGLYLTMFRLLLGRLWFLFPQNRYRTVCRTNHDYIDYFIDLALKQDLASTHVPDKQPSLVGGLSVQTDDRNFIRSQVLQGMMASQETTSALLGNACFLLSRQPAYWQKIRDAIANYELDDFDFDMLLSLKTVQHILHETLRLYPIFPLMGRNAIRDTTLPVGGGPTQSGPVFVAKDTVVTMSYFALHRDPAVYGDDAAEFRPERWETIQPTYWEFMGFGGGNRECLGQQKVLVEAAYVLVRLAKEFEALESRDKEDWVGEMKLTCKSKNGCKVALYREGSTAQS